MTLGERIKQLREELGMSQGELAKAAHVAPSYIGHIESDRRQPSRDVIKKLAMALGTTTQDLLSAAGYLRPPATPSEALPSYHTYVRRKFPDDPKLQKALIAAYEALAAGREEEEEGIREARRRTKPGRLKE